VGTIQNTEKPDCRVTRGRREKLSTTKSKRRIHIRKERKGNDDKGRHVSALF